MFALILSKRIDLAPLPLYGCARLAGLLFVRLFPLPTLQAEYGQGYWDYMGNLGCRKVSFVAIPQLRLVHLRQKNFGLKKEDQVQTLRGMVVKEEEGHHPWAFVTRQCGQVF